jgi:transposase-like protein
MAKRHVEDRSSYRVIAKRCREKLGTRTTAKAICKMVNEVARRAKTTMEVAQELKPAWSGWLCIDGKVIRIKGVKYCLLIGVDIKKDIVHGLLAEGEFRSAWKQFHEELWNKLRYPMRGCISDMDEDLEWGFQQVWGAKPHQYCTKHMDDTIDRLTNYNAIKRKLDKLKEKLDDVSRQAAHHAVGFSAARQKKVVQIQKAIAELRQTDKWELELRDLAQAFIYAKTKAEALKAFNQILKRKRYYKKGDLTTLVSSLQRYKEGLLAHFDHPQMPRTNNVAENVIKQLERRLKTIEGFQTYPTAQGYLNLLILYLRFKPFTDCRRKNKHQNGKSRLELVGVETKKLDWIKFSQRKGGKKTNL